MSQPKSCTHIKVTGVRCGSPALRGEQFCYFHQRMLRTVRFPSLPRPPLRPPRGRRIHPGLPHGSRQRPAPRHHRTQARRTHPPRPQHRRPQHPPRPLRPPPGRNDPRDPRLPRPAPRPSRRTIRPPNSPPPTNRAEAARSRKDPTWPNTSVAPTKFPHTCKTNPTCTRIQQPGTRRCGDGRPRLVQAAQKYRAAVQRHRAAAACPKPNPQAATRRERSSEGAKECSPPRKRWVSSDQ